MKRHTLLGILCVIGGALIQITFGYFYTVGNMASYMIDYLNYHNMSTDKSSAVWLTSVAISLEAVAMPLGGLMERKTGFRLVVILSCIMHSGSIALTYFALRFGFIAVVFTYGVLQGFGFGFGYAVIIAVAANWFPTKRSLIMGLIVGGFGAGALIFTPIQTSYINPNNVQVDNVTRTFTDPDVLNRIPKACLVLAAITVSIQVVGILLMRGRRAKEQMKNLKDELETLEQLQTAEGDKKKDVDEVMFVDEKTKAMEIGDHSESKAKNVTTKVDKVKTIDIPPKEALKTLDFYLLWLAVCFSVIPITVLSSLYKMVGQSFISDDLFLAGVAMAASLCNAGGRVIWGSICDRLSYKLPYCLMLIVWCAMLFAFPHISVLTGVTAKVVYCLWVCLLFVCLSGVFVFAPTATSVLFGPTHMAVNYGLVYNAFIVGSMLAAVLTKVIHESTGFTYQFGLSGLMCIVALLIILWTSDHKTPARFQFLNCFYRLREKYCGSCGSRCCRRENAEQHKETAIPA